MLTTLYKKVGRKYVPVQQYDSEATDSLPYGSHLIVVRPGCKTTRLNVDTAFAPAIAAGIYAIDEISAQIVKAGELRSHQAQKLTEDQLAALNAFLKTLSDTDRHYLTHGSAREAAQAGIDKMIEQMNSLLNKPAVKQAYEHFLLVSKLTMEENNAK
jgi:hypothetical protein